MNYLHIRLLENIVHCLVFKEHLCFFNSLELTFNILSYPKDFVKHFFQFIFQCFIFLLSDALSSSA